MLIQSWFITKRSSCQQFHILPHHLMAVLNFRAENISQISNWPSVTFPRPTFSVWRSQISEQILSIITSIPLNCFLAFFYIHKSTGLSGVTCHCTSTWALLFQHGPLFECNPWVTAHRKMARCLSLASVLLRLVQAVASAAGYVCVTQTLPLIVHCSEKHLSLHFHIWPPLLSFTSLGVQRPVA